MQQIYNATYNGEVFTGTNVAWHMSCTCNMCRRGNPPSYYIYLVGGIVGSLPNANWAPSCAFFSELLFVSVLDITKKKH